VATKSARTSASATPVLRADAERNRNRILRAAAEAFATTGPDTPVEEIASSAGVAVGTLYRRFPDRQALIRGVALMNFAKTVAEVQLAAQEESTGWDALVRIFGQSQHLRLAMRFALELPTARRILEGDPDAVVLKRQMIAVFDAVVQKAQAEGSVRTDIGSGDVAVAFVFLARQIPAPHIESAPLATQRILALMLDAFRAHPVEPLPGRPLTPADLGLD
jgi:AcrR family transcriptional regulator